MQFGLSIDDFKQFLMLLGYAVASGLAVRKFANWVSLGMRYGNVFWLWRYFVIWLFAKDRKKFKESFNAARKTEIDVRDENVENVYAYHAVYWSRNQLCELCFGTHYLIIGTIIFSNLYDTDLITALLFFLFAFISFRK